MNEPGSPAPEPARSGLAQLWRDLCSLDRAAVVILVSAPILLTLLDYLGLPWHYTRAVERRAQTVGMTEHAPRAPEIVRWLGEPELFGPPTVRSYVWWGLAVALLLIVLPLVVARVGARLSPRDIGLKLAGTARDAPVYLLLYLVFLPVLWWVSRDPHFQQTYPFYKPTAGVLAADFLVFQAVYCVQFLGVELFFRGFLVLGLKRALGLSSVLVMLAPYCMIHYYKPMPEALGSIAAGLLLGLLAWRTGTVVYGWFLHYAVALSMDLLALHQTDRL